MTDIYCVHDKVFGQRKNSLLTNEEQQYIDSQKLAKAVPQYALYAFAEIVCNLSRELCRAISDPRNTRNKWRPIDQYDGKVLSLCDRIMRGIDTFYDAYIRHLAKMQTYNTIDVYDAVACTNEAVTEATKDKMIELWLAIDKEMSDIRPLDPYLFSSVNRLLFHSMLFLRYRKSFQQEMNEDSIDVFRTLKIDNLIHELANTLQMQDREGKTVYYLFTGVDVYDWCHNGGRKRFHRREVAKTHAIDFGGKFGSKSIDKASFYFLREVFRIKNIDTFIAAGNGGRSPGYSRYIRTDYFFGCMHTYEQFSFTALMLEGDIEAALERLSELHRAFPDGDLFVCYQNENGHSQFAGIYTSVDEAQRELGDPARAIVLSLEGNKAFLPGKHNFHITHGGRIYFRLNLLEEWLRNRINLKKNYYE